MDNLHSPLPLTFYYRWDTLFKVGLLDTYHRGILLGLEWVRLVQDETGAWHYPARDQQEKITAVLTGYVRYENIQRINWDGDEYYGLPHIYCHFDEKGKMPYEKLMFCERRELKPEGFVYYTDLASFDDVVELSKSNGTSHYYPPAKRILHWSEGEPRQKASDE